MEIKINGIYRHYKGDKYIIEDIATNSETLEQWVIYRGLYGAHQLWIRPLSMFFDEVDDNQQKYRFELIDIKSVRE